VGAKQATPTILSALVLANPDRPAGAGRYSIGSIASA
jgi:hypothetical protein